MIKGERMLKHLIIFTLIPVASINAFDAHDIDIRQTNNKASKKASKPDLDAIKKCTAIPTGTIGVWDENLSYRASIGGKSGLVIGDSFISNSEIEKISKTNNKDCVFKTQASGRDLYFNIVDDGKKKSIHWSSESPSTTCSTFKMQKPSKKSLTRSLSFLAESIELNTNLLISELSSDFENNQQPTQNTAIKRSDLKKHKDIIANCQIAYESMTNKSSDIILKNDKELVEINKHNSQNALFTNTNAGASSKNIKNLNLSWDYDDELKSCVDNLPVSKTIRAFGENQISKCTDNKGVKFIYKAIDGKFYSLEKALASKARDSESECNKRNQNAIQEANGRPGKYWLYESGVCQPKDVIKYKMKFDIRKTLTTELPNGEKITIIYSMMNFPNSDGSFTQKESVVFSEGGKSNETQTVNDIFKPSSEAEYISSIIGNLQDAMSSYTNDPRINYKNLSEEIKESHISNFKRCTALMNKIAPDEKKWNDMAYRYANNETVLERAYASEKSSTLNK